NGIVYAGSENGRLYAFNAQTGTTLWIAITEGYIHSSPAVANGVVYVGSLDGKLYAFTVQTGPTFCVATPGARVDSSPVVANGVVYVGSRDGKLYAFAPLSLPVVTPLNQSYMGTTRGFANGSITFSLISEDQQGNVSLGVTFTTSDNTKQAL